MLLRGLIYQGTAVLIGLATVGLGWLYIIGGALGPGRRTLYDEWAQVVVLQKPKPIPTDTQNAEPVTSSRPPEP